MCLAGIMHGLHKLLLFHVLTCLGRIAHGSVCLITEARGNVCDITYKEKAPENSMLYMASLQGNRGHQCGGFLISEDFVVTAAHCGTDSRYTQVVLGTHDLKKSNQRIRVEKIFKKASYHSTWYGDDIMLLKLSSKAQLGSRVETIPLPTSEINIKELEQCTVAGWEGSIHGEVTDHLEVLKVSITDPEECKEKWPGLPANVICAGGYKTKLGFCQGDGGGPLVCNGKAVGIVSFGRCDDSDVPTVYTDISRHLNWINTILKGYK